MLGQLLRKIEEPAESCQHGLANLNFINRYVAYLVPFFVCRSFIRFYACFDKRRTILATMSIKKTKKWPQASSHFRPVYITALCCQKHRFL